ncbi:hypothetical protein CYANOKiyG1_40270 [Okeania sp. KiyG1]|nr:hypothetical protein CYANOKiyG1_40270 [Okeania sp. KiyG1]
MTLANLLPSEQVANVFMPMSTPIVSSTFSVGAGSISYLKLMYQLSAFFDILTFFTLQFGKISYVFTTPILGNCM